MARLTIRRTAAALALITALGLLPAALDAAPLLNRNRQSDAQSLVQRPGERGFVQSFWSLLTAFWAKAGAKIDGNG